MVKAVKACVSINTHGAQDVIIPYSFYCYTYYVLSINKCASTNKKCSNISPSSPYSFKQSSFAKLKVKLVSNVN